MVTNIISKDFTPDKIDELILFLKKCIIECYRPYYPKEAVDYFLKYHNKEKMLEKAKMGNFILLLNQDKIIGTGCIIKDIIEVIFVDPEYQNNGFGTDILYYLEMNARKSGIRLTKLNAMKVSFGFFEKAGYKTIRKYQEKVNNMVIDYFEMTRMLPK
ncbi:GNAT family N-acetyltransferase [Bacteroidota bacterium]